MIIFLNGTTSSGKSTLAKALQEHLQGLWLTTGIDHAIDMAPLKMHHNLDGFYFSTEEGHEGELVFGAMGEALLDAHRNGVAAMGRAGYNVILDEVMVRPDFIGLWQNALAGLDVLWVGVTCSLEEIERREVDRGNRRFGQGAWQFPRIHQVMHYDLVVDTTNGNLQSCVKAIAEALVERQSCAK